MEKISNFCMRKSFLLWTLTLFIAVGFLSCKGKENGNEVKLEAVDSVMEVKYAHGFKVSYHHSYKRVVVYDQLTEKGTPFVYYLVDNADTKTPSDGTKIVAPIQSIGISSCTHVGELEFLGLTDKVSCLCNPEYIFHEQMRKAAEEGKVINLGDATNVNIEILLSAKPDVMMTSIYNMQDENIQRLFKVGIPLLVNNEWMEQDPLGRAEWVKLIATFFNEEQHASTLFNAMESDYLNTKEIVTEMGHKPTIMLGNNYKGTWYMPSGQNYMAKLMIDAGADYFYANDSTTGSLPLSFETVLQKFKHVDVWMNAPVATLKELTEMDDRHKLFDPLKNGEVYSFMGRVLPNSMANDFWESGVVHPELLLKDIVWALHPELVPNHTPYYIIKLK